jgi:hypothetical protein
MDVPATAAANANADKSEKITILEENDSLYFNSDKHYTQGLRLSYLGPEIDPSDGWNRPFEWLGGLAPVFFSDGSGEHSRRYSLLLGQSIFTPRRTDLFQPDPRDRPYAGWLYAGASLLQETNHWMLENFEIDLGVVGPAALGKVVQNDFHEIIDVNQARGWKNQIQNEPGIMLSYERKWRLPLLGNGQDGVDIIPQGGATIGNVMTYGEAGALLRIGRGLQADYGPVRVRPALSGTDYANARAEGDFGYYFFAGAAGRVVGQNIFLDGNSFRTSRSVDKKPLVADLQAGASMFWSNGIRLDFSVARRTMEFEGQGSPDVIGTAAFSFTW